MDLTAAQWERIAPLMPTPRGNHVKIPHRQVLDARLYVYDQGCTWRGLPRECGDWHTFYVWLNRWAKYGVLEWVARELQQELLAELDLDALSRDRTIIPVHAHGTGALRNGGSVERTLSLWSDDQAARTGRQRPHPTDRRTHSWSSSTTC